MSLADFDSGPVPAFRATLSWYTFAFFHCAVAGVRIRF